MAQNNISKNSNVARVHSTSGIDFFYKWLSFIKPLHNLTKLEMKVMALILAKRQELMFLVKDETLINNLLKSSQMRRDMRNELDMTSTQFNILYSNLKRAGAIDEDRVLSKFIPNVECDSKEYRLILIFDINEKKGVDVQQKRPVGDGEESISKA